ncbi:MAG: Na+/H+ antiporter subunit E [Phototrophicaceae bacterium]
MNPFTLILSLILAPIFVVLTGHYTWGTAVIGWLLSVLALRLGHAQQYNLRITRGFSQLVALLQYVSMLAFDIFWSSVKVARLVLNPHMPIQPGIVKISTQDIPSDSHDTDLVTALSAHWITITPGQFVIDIEKNEQETFMYVHNLHLDAQLPTIHDEQTLRLKLIRKVLGYD